MKLTKIEWWDVCRRARPDLTWSEYEKLWEDFLVYQRAKRLN